MRLRPPPRPALKVRATQGMRGGRRFAQKCAQIRQRTQPEVTRFVPFRRVGCFSRSIVFDVCPATMLRRCAKIGGKFCAPTTQTHLQLQMAKNMGGSFGHLRRNARKTGCQNRRCRPDRSTIARPHAPAARETSRTPASALRWVCQWASSARSRRQCGTGRACRSPGWQ